MRGERALARGSVDLKAGSIVKLNNAVVITHSRHEPGLEQIAVEAAKGAGVISGKNPAHLRRVHLCGDIKVVCDTI